MLYALGCCEEEEKGGGARGRGRRQRRGEGRGVQAIAVDSSGASVWAVTDGEVAYVIA